MRFAHLMRLLKHDHEAFECFMKMISWEQFRHGECLSSVFIWGFTPQGHDYWERLDVYLKEERVNDRK